MTAANVVPGQPVGSSVSLVAVTPAISAAAYSAGQTIGGVMAFAGMASTGADGGILQSITATDGDGQGAAVDLYFFSATLANPPGNKATWAISDADRATFLGHVSIAAGDWKTDNGKSLACVRSVGLLYKLAAGLSTLYVQAVNRGTPTYTGTGKLTFALAAVQN
jgi:hypothetical protein